MTSSSTPAGLVAGCLVAGALVAGCGSGSGTINPTTAATSSGDSSSSSTPDSNFPTFSASPTSPSKPVGFHQPVTWIDGLSIAVVKITTATIQRTDHGGSTGGTKTVFSIRISNHRTRTYASSGVVVSATYGSSHHTASLVTSGKSSVAAHERFPASIKARDSATARYSFAIPSADRSDVTLTVRPADHSTRGQAVFTGSTT